jgi:hypothetical protein
MRMSSTGLKYPMYLIICRFNRVGYMIWLIADVEAPIATRNHLVRSYIVSRIGNSSFLHLELYTSNYRLKIHGNL